VGEDEIYTIVMHATNQITFTSLAIAVRTT
jgi:hypothetical protein